MAMAQGVEMTRQWQLVGMASQLYQPELLVRMAWDLHVPHKWLEMHSWKLPSVRLDLTWIVLVASGS